MTVISKFKNSNKVGIANAWTTVYTAPSLKDSYVIELDISCVGTTGVQVSVRVSDSSAGTASYVVKAATIPLGASLQVVDTQKIVLETGDHIDVICDTSGQVVDVICSVIEDVNN